MFPLLVGGILIFIVGNVMLLVPAFLASTGWGVLCLLLPPVQWLFAMLNWEKVWDALLMQLFGAVMVLAFFLNAADGFSRVSMQQGWEQFKREQGLQVVAMQATSGGPVELQGQQVQSVTAETKENGEVIHSVEGDTAPAAVTVQAAPPKAVDDKPIYKCTDGEGKETWSTEPCKPFKVPAKK